MSGDDFTIVFEQLEKFEPEHGHGAPVEVEVDFDAEELEVIDQLRRLALEISQPQNLHFDTGT